MDTRRPLKESKTFYFDIRGVQFRGLSRVNPR